MTIDTIGEAAGPGLHPRHARTGVAFTPAPVPQVAPHFNRSIQGWPR